MSNPDRYEAGVEVMRRLFGRKPDRAHLPEHVFDSAIEHVYGGVWTRPGLTLQERSLFTVTALVASGSQAELELHLLGARNLGVPREKAEELMLHLAQYCGWPCAMQGFRAIQRVYDRSRAEDPSAKP
jgi:4-carboxymuconolactone decarboxylase